MSLEIKNTKQLIQPGMRWKVLVIGAPGSGKTSWASGAESPGIAACETGWGSGLISRAEAGLDYIEPRQMPDFEAFCTGQVFREKSTLVADSLTAMTRTFIKDYALSMPRLKGPNSPKRQAGVPELDDYGTIGEVARRLLSRLLDVPKHIVVTTGIRAEKDENGNAISLGPDLPGQLFLGAPAMFDTVLMLKTRRKLRDPANKKSEYTEHYFITENDGFHVAKCRNQLKGVSLLDREEVFDLATGQGSWQYLYNKILKGYNLT